MKTRIFSIAAMLLPALLIAGCATGQRKEQGAMAPAAMQQLVPARYVSLRYHNPRLGPSAKSGLSVSAHAQPITSTIMYRYSLTSHINGNYVLMPNPPTVYTIFKTPVYQVAPRRIEFSVTLYNRSKMALLPSKAIAAVEANGYTLFEKEILLPGILPGQRATVTVEGPPVWKLAQRNPNGVMRFGVYQVRIGDHIDNFWWKTGYALVQRVEKLPATVVLRTPREDDARHILERLRRRDGAGTSRRTGVSSAMPAATQ